MRRVGGHGSALRPQALPQVEIARELLARTHPPGGTDAGRVAEGWKVDVGSEQHHRAIRCVWCR